MLASRRSLFLAAALLPLTAFGHVLFDNDPVSLPPYRGAHDTLQASLVEVDVVAPRTERRFAMFEAADRQVYVAGESGQSYVLRVRNRTAARILVVPSVDGVNAITGQTASSQQSGYIVPPYAEVVIDGWRKSTREVAEFIFTAQGESYAAQTGRPANVGVIGLAIFREQQEVRLASRGLNESDSKAAAADAAVPPAAPSALNSAGEASPAATGVQKMRAPTAALQEKLGTGHGQRQASAVQYGEFRRQSGGPAEVVQLRYDSLRNLEAQGIALRAPIRVRPQPVPFPNDGFVPDPPRR